MVNSLNGIEIVTLIIKIMGENGPLEFNRDDFTYQLKKLVEDNEIVELKYTSPQLKHRIKSMYFPKGTIFGNQIGNNKQNPSIPT